MGALEDFQKSIKTISHGGIHDYNEAIKRTPEGFVLTKMVRNLDFYHWDCEWTKIDEWEKNGGQSSEDVSLQFNNPNVAVRIAKDEAMRRLESWKGDFTQRNYTEAGIDYTETIFGYCIPSHFKVDGMDAQSTEHIVVDKFIYIR